MTVLLPLIFFFFSLQFQYFLHVCNGFCFGDSEAVPGLVKVSVFHRYYVLPANQLWAAPYPDGERDSFLCQWVMSRTEVTLCALLGLSLNYLGTLAAATPETGLSHELEWLWKLVLACSMTVVNPVRAEDQNGPLYLLLCMKKGTNPRAFLQRTGSIAISDKSGNIPVFSHI